MALTPYLLKKLGQLGALGLKAAKPIAKPAFNLAYKASNYDPILHVGRLWDDWGKTKMIGQAPMRDIQGNIRKLPKEAKRLARPIPELFRKRSERANGIYTYGQRLGEKYKRKGYTEIRDPLTNEVTGWDPPMLHKATRIGLDFGLPIVGYTGLDKAAQFAKTAFKPDPTTENYRRFESRIYGQN